LFSSFDLLNVTLSYEKLEIFRVLNINILNFCEEGSAMRFSATKFCGLLILTMIAMNFGCKTKTNENTSVNANVTTNVANVSTSEKELPPGFSASPLPIQGTTPGIPDPNAVNSVPKGTTPTPGIPDVKELNKPFKPGKTPTPGIPDEETLRRQLNTPVDPSVVNQPIQTPSNQQRTNKDKSSDK